MRHARAALLSSASGVFFRFDVKYSCLPWTLDRLVSEAWSGEEKDALCQQLASARRCDTPLFAQCFRERFPTAASMRTPEAAATIQVWSAGKLFSTKRSELGHAQERTALSAAAAPGRSFAHHIRKDLLRKARVAHVEAGGRDPQKEAALRVSAAAALAQPAPGRLAGVSAVGDLLPDGEMQSIVAATHDFQQDPPEFLPRAGPWLHERLALAGCAAPPAAVMDTPPDNLQNDPRGMALLSGAGGNVYFTFLNEQRRILKLSRVGRKLTQAELGELHIRARAEWSSMNANAREAFRLRYQAQVRQRQLGRQVAPVAQPGASFRPSLRSNDPDYVIPTARFCQVFFRGCRLGRRRLAIQRLMSDLPQASLSCLTQHIGITGPPWNRIFPRTLWFRFGCTLGLARSIARGHMFLPSSWTGPARCVPKKVWRRVCCDGEGCHARFAHETCIHK